MARTISFTPGEWYHCYSRGVDKRVLFMDTSEYERFQMQLYAANSIIPIQVSTVTKHDEGPTLDMILAQARNERLVDLGAYALMPNHYHLLLRERIEGGVTSFMRRLNTGYTMYFNKRHERTGALFSGAFKASHVDTQAYLQRLVHYIHGNPAEIIEKGWKLGRVRNEEKMSSFLREYPYSSLPEYESAENRGGITDRSALMEFLEEQPSIHATIRDAYDFARDPEVDLDPIELHALSNASKVRP